MSKLREKYCNLIDNDKGYDNLGLAEKLEQISDDFADKYVIWFNQNVYQMILHKGYYYKNELKTLQELRQIFKDNIYGKE